MDPVDNYAEHKCSSGDDCKCLTLSGTYSKHTMNGDFGTKKILVEIPQSLIEEIRILSSNHKPLCYVLFAEKLSKDVKVDGYARISQTYDFTSYDINEVVCLVKAGRYPVLIIHTREGPMHPTPKETMTWWVNDHALGFPLNHAILSVEKGKIEFEVFSLRECFFCERKSEPLKNFDLRLERCQ